MLILELTLIITLLYLTIEDIRCRSIHWIYFPILAIEFILWRVYPGEYIIDVAKSTAINIIFVLIVMILVTGYFSIKYRKFIDITNELLGWGEILFLLAMSAAFSVSFYLLFYVSTLSVTLVTWFFFRRFFRNQLLIPVAGLQAAALAVFLVIIWVSGGPDTGSDLWMLKLIGKWRWMM